jgi:hypothetical protein
MQAWNNGIVLTGHEIECLLGFTSKDPKLDDRHCWGVVFTVVGDRIRVAACNGRIAVEARRESPHGLVEGEWYVRRPTLERVKPAAKGGCSVAFLIDGYAMRRCIVLEENDETTRYYPGDQVLFQNPYEQLDIFGLLPLDEVLRLPRGNPCRCSTFCGEYTALTELVGNAAVGCKGGSVTIYPAPTMTDPWIITAQSLEEDESKRTIWRAAIMPRAPKDDDRPVPEPEDVSGYRLEPTESAARKAAKSAMESFKKTAEKTGTTVTLRVPGEEEVVVADGAKREEPGVPYILDGWFHCPCGAKHDRGPIDGENTYRCLKCGYTHRILPAGESAAPAEPDQPTAETEEEDRILDADEYDTTPPDDETAAPPSQPPKASKVVPLGQKGKAGKAAKAKPTRGTKK